MRHQKIIADLLSSFHEEWMDFDDKAKMNSELLRAAGKTMEQLDAEIEIGVRNGYPPETQLAIYKRVVAMLVKPNDKVSHDAPPLKRQ
jgi:hypothetical protein